MREQDYQNPVPRRLTAATINALIEALDDGDDPAVDFAIEKVCDGGIYAEIDDGENVYSVRLIAQIRNAGKLPCSACAGTGGIETECSICRGRG